jgi:hypothetical protein
MRPSVLFVTAWLLASITSADGQEPLYTPRTIDQAIARGTRSRSGLPGPRYWQNRARYAIDVSVAPPDRLVRGSEQITYYNNSPDSLRELVFKLVMNIHKPGAPRTIAFSNDYLTDGVTIDSFAVNGVALPWTPDSPFTTASVKLPAPLPAHDSVRLAFRWHYSLSRQPAREGVIDSTTFYMAYFYPRVAVYDDYAGWDRVEFTDLQEFYSDFNDYDVTLHVPANVIVWGTGTLTNASAVLRPAYFQRFTESLASDGTIRIATKAELSGGRVTQGTVWHFTASNVPDVAFGLSDHYDWDAASAIVDSASNRRASVQAAYNDSAADFHAMVQMARHSLSFMSHQWPGVPYPYEKTTVFQGGAGMEYPMMVNDESYADSAVADLVAAHEIAHTWFPFYMGINETRYAFMDEGWATTLEYLAGRVKMGVAAETNLFRTVRVSPWVNDPSPLADLPIITPADVLHNPAYRANAYGKAALGYLALREFLGDSLFRRSLHAYMGAWHGKHPTPWDFFNTFTAASGRNLNWFWNAWYFRSGYIDLAVRAVSRVPNGFAISLENVGGLPAPVDLRLTFTDGTAMTVHETVGMWSGDQRHASVTVGTTKALRSVDLSGDIWMDANPSNDRWPSGPPR